MPQKLKYVARFTGDNDASLGFGAEGVAKRPELALLLMQVLVEWSLLEHSLADSLAHTLDTQPELGVEVFLSLEHNSAQLKVVRDTAAFVLKEEDLALYDAILALVRQGGRERNTIAHGVWGSTDRVTDGLLLLPRKGMVRFTAPLSVLQPVTPSRYEAIRKKLENMDINAYIDVINDSLVYRRHEFEATYNLIVQTRKFIDRFWLIHKTTGPVHEQQRQQLCNEPAIQEVLFRQSKDQTTPE